MPKPFAPDGTLRPSRLAPGLFTACLPSGLRVIVKEDHRSPVAVCNVWVAVGSNREPEPLRGWSHGVEHMLFKGTARRGEGDFAREVAEAGGTTNAGTGYETTDYHVTLPAEHLGRAVDILGDALLRSTFAPAALDAEREVLVHENHMYDDLPFGFGVTWRWAMELAFDRSPYRHPIGGRDDNLRARSRRDIMAYWRAAYRPQAMAVVIVGAVSAPQALALVKERFDSFPPAPRRSDPRTAPLAAPPRERPHRAPRLRVAEGDIHKAYAKLVLPAPAHRRDPHRAAAVIRQILAEGRSSRLYRRVQEQLQLIDDFLVYVEAGPREGVLVIDLETDAHRLPRALRQVWAVLRGLADDGGTPAELRRAKVRAARAFLFGAETVQGQARTIGRHLMLDDLPGAFRYPELVQEVTAAEVAALAACTFDLNRLSAVIYLPAGTPAAECGIPADAAELRRLLEGSRGAPASGRLPAAGRSAASKPAPSAAAARGRRTGVPPRPVPPAGAGADRGAAAGFTAGRLVDGVDLQVRVDRSLPVVALALTTVGGGAGETAATAGLANLMHMVQVKDAGGRSAAALHGLLEGEGAALAPVVDRDYAGLVLTALSDRLERPLRLLRDVVLAPEYRPEQIERERRLALEQLAAMQDNPLQAGIVALRELLYGDHPYGRPLVGTAASLPRLGRARILAAHGRVWTRANLQVVVSGDVDPDRLLPQLQALAAALPAGRRRRPDPGQAQAPQGIEQRRLRRALKQCVVLEGWPGATAPQEHRAERLLMREILNGQSGRLFEQLRNRRSLCYSTGVVGTSGFGQGMVLAYVMTSPQSEERARRALLQQLQRMAERPVGPAELATAKAKLLGNLAIATQTNGARAARAARNRIFGRPADDLPQLAEAVRACDARAVQAAAQVFDPARRCEVVVGP